MEQANLRRHRCSRGGIAALVVLSLFLLAGFWVREVLVGAEATIRYRIHATVEIEGETYRGSSVWEAHLQQARALTFTRHVAVRGEALMLRGSGERNLFFIRRAIGGNGSESYGAFVLDCIPGNPPSGPELIEVLDRDFKGPCHIKRELPTLIEMPDLTDPSSAKRLPYRYAANWPCSSTCLKEFWIERTGEPVTTGLKQILPWLAGLKEPVSDIVTGETLVAVSSQSTSVRMEFTTE